MGISSHRNTPIYYSSDFLWDHQKRIPKFGKPHLGTGYHFVFTNARTRRESVHGPQTGDHDFDKPPKDPAQKRGLGRRACSPKLVSGCREGGGPG